MKKLNTLLILAVSIGLSACAKKGCNDVTAENYDASAEQNDGSCNFAPYIVLNGEPVVTIGTSASYIDEGATAYNRDGSAVEIEDNAYIVTPGVAGEYNITYTATNEYGSASVTRKVIIEMSREDILGDWDISSDCGFQFPIDGAKTLNAGLGNEIVDIPDFFTLVGGNALAIVTNLEIFFPEQTIPITGGEVTFSGNGTISGNANSMTVNFEYDNTVPLIGGSGTCTATFSR